MPDWIKTTHDICWEVYIPAYNQFTLSDYKVLKRRGVPPQAFADLHGPGKASIVRKDGAAELSETGEAELVFPCWRDGFIRGLVTWNGASFATLEGTEVLLGFDTLEGWGDHIHPLRIFRSPIDWLAADGEGVCLVRQESAWKVLDGFESFQADDIEHARELRQVLQRPQRTLDIVFSQKECAA